jgi:hypothetical protein
LPSTWIVCWNRWPAATVGYRPAQLIHDGFKFLDATSHLRQAAAVDFVASLLYSVGVVV